MRRLQHRYAILYATQARDLWFRVPAAGMRVAPPHLIEEFGERGVAGHGEGPSDRQSCVVVGTSTSVQASWAPILWRGHSEGGRECLECTCISA